MDDVELWSCGRRIFVVFDRSGFDGLLKDRFLQELFKTQWWKKYSPITPNHCSKSKNIMCLCFQFTDVQRAILKFLQIQEPEVNFHSFSSTQAKHHFPTMTLVKFCCHTATICQGANSFLTPFIYAQSRTNSTGRSEQKSHRAVPRFEWHCWMLDMLQ